MEKISYAELCNSFRAYNMANRYSTKGTPTKISGVVVISQESFTQEYSLEQRSYRVTSDNKAFFRGACSNSVFADCLDGVDLGVRLDWYIPTDWKVEYCYLENGGCLIVKYKVWNYRDFVNMVKHNGYVEVKMGVQSSHRIFYRESDKSTIVIPLSVNPMLCRRLVKENNLDITL